MYEILFNKQYTDCLCVHHHHHHHHHHRADTIKCEGHKGVKNLTGDHFPDHMKFPDFFSRGKQRLPDIECLPIWSTVIVSH